MKIPDGIKTLPSRAISSLNKTGKNVCSALNDAKSKADKFVKSNDTKDTANKVGKNTIIGAAVSLGALMLSIQFIKGIRNKVKETNNKN